MFIFQHLWHRDFDIRTRVISLISVLLIPLLILSSWLAYNYADAERRVIETRRYDVVNNLSFLFDRELAQVQGALTALASSPELTKGNFSQFRSHAQSVASMPQISSIVVFDRSGQQLFTTMVPEGETLPKRDDMSPIEAAFGGTTVISGVVVGTISKQFSVAVSVPVYRDGKVAYVLSSGILLDRFAKLFGEAGLEPGWVSAVVDAEGIFVSRSLNPQNYIGKPARPELAAAARGISDTGVFDNTTLEGLVSANSFRRSKLTGWTSVVAISKSELAAPLRRVQIWILTAGLAISLASLAVAWRMATRISEPVRKLSEASVALVEGRPIPDFTHQITELTEVRTAFEHAGAKLAHLAAIVASSGDAILSVGLDGKILSWNPGAERLFGFKAEEIIGKPKTLIIPEELISVAIAQLKLAQSGERVRTETQRLRRDGTRVEVSLDLAPIGDKHGAVIAMSTIAHDITDKKLAEEHQHFLMRELTHRSKNLLAVINAMARQTVRSADSLADFEKRFSSRIQGLAASHDILVSQDWAAAPLRELIAKHINIFADKLEARLELSGPEVYVGVEAAQTIGLALHELATNSVKYGALSQPNGKIIVHWKFENMEDGGSGLRVSWQERGGPPVIKPTRTGFGHIVTERMIAQSLNGDVTIDYAPTGLIWILKFPAAHLVKRPTTLRPVRALTA